MKKRLAVLFTMLILSTAIFAEIELGMSFTPGEVLVTPETAAAMQFIGAEESTSSSILGFHLGYSFAWLFYASFDSLIVPPWWIYQTTSYTSADGVAYSGINAPGYINFFDVGIRPSIGPLYILATAGFNTLYIHSGYEQLSDNSLGVNMRIGIGLKFDAFSINITGTSIFNNFDQLTSTVNKIYKQDQTATDDFLSTLIPSIGFVLHLD